MTEVYRWNAGLAWGQFSYGAGTVISDFVGVVRRDELEAFVDGLKVQLSGQVVEGVLLDFAKCGIATTTGSMLNALGPFREVPVAVIGTPEQSELLDAYEVAARFADVRHKHAPDQIAAAEWLGVIALNRRKIIL